MVVIFVDFLLSSAVVDVATQGELGGIWEQGSRSSHGRDAVLERVCKTMYVHVEKTMFL